MSKRSRSGAGRSSRASSAAAAATPTSRPCGTTSRRLRLRPPGLRLTQPEALDLAGGGAREVVDELDHVRVLVAAQVLLAPHAQLVGQRVRVGRVVGADD